MGTTDFEIKQARYDFQCGICGTMIKKGENYTVDKDGDEICTHINEATGTRQKAKGNPKKITNMVLEELKKEKAMDHLRKQNLMMRLELEEIAARPDGRAAKKIINKYRRIKRERDERLTAIQN